MLQQPRGRSPIFDVWKISRHDGELCGLRRQYFILVFEKKVLPFQIGFGILFAIIVVLQWQDWTSVFVLCAKVLSTVSLGFKNTKTIRILNLISTPCWFAYNISIPNYTGMLSDLLMLTSLVSAMIRIDIIGARREKAKE